MTGTTSDPQTRAPRRADARRNREAVLTAAAQVFTELGVDASLEEVARRAGVGIGTLYRHFPARAALVAAVYRHEVEVLCDAVPGLRERNPPDVALAEWMQSFVGYVATKKGLAAALRAQNDGEQELFAYVHDRIRGALDTLITAAVDQGSIRADVEPGDLLRALGGICMVSDDGWQQRARRLVALLMDGLRYGATGTRPA